MTTYEKDPDNELWEKEIKEAHEFSLATPRDKDHSLYAASSIGIFHTKSELMLISLPHLWSG
jgi:hypothetical protein